jgi:hypothetical protein
MCLLKSICAILWRSDLALSVHVLSVVSRRICAVRMFNNSLKLLFINMYMPYEGDDAKTLDFVDQLSIAESLINDNSDCVISMLILLGIKCIQRC